MKFHFKSAALALLSICAACDGHRSYAYMVEDGNETGNGGDVVYCADPQPGQKKIELLDLYESRIYWPDRNLKFGSSTDPQAIAQNAIKRLSPHVLDRPKTYSTWSQSFFKQTEFVTQDLIDVPDSLHVFLPENCEIRQIAIQIKDPAPNGVRYFINRPLWDLLDVENKAALILHELLYRDAIHHGAKDSLSVRDLNRYFWWDALYRNDSAKADSLVYFFKKVWPSNLMPLRIKVPNADIELEASFLVGRYDYLEASNITFGNFWGHTLNFTGTPKVPNGNKFRWPEAPVNMNWELFLDDNTWMKIAWKDFAPFRVKGHVSVEGLSAFPTKRMHFTLVDNHLFKNAHVQLKCAAGGGLLLDPQLSYDVAACTADTDYDDQKIYWDGTWTPISPVFESSSNSYEWSFAHFVPSVPLRLSRKNFQGYCKADEMIINDTDSRSGASGSSIRNCDLAHVASKFKIGKNWIDVTLHGLSWLSGYWRTDGVPDDQKASDYVWAVHGDLVRDAQIDLRESMFDENSAPFVSLKATKCMSVRLPSDYTFELSEDHSFKFGATTLHFQGAKLFQIFYNYRDRDWQTPYNIRIRGTLSRPAFFEVGYDSKKLEAPAGAVIDVFVKGNDVVLSSDNYDYDDKHRPKFRDLESYEMSGCPR